MKKIFSVFLLALTLFNFCSIANASYIPPVPSPAPTPTNEVHICDKIQLKEFAKEVNFGGQAKNAAVKLDTDLEITLEDNWIPIGTSENPFMGQFDGQLHKITLNVNTPNKDNVGLFGVAKGALFKGLIVEGKIIGRDNVAAFVGSGENLRFENCYTALCKVQGNNFVAPFIGLGYGNFLICYSYASVNISGHNRGGFIGYSTRKSLFNMCTSNCPSQPVSSAFTKPTDVAQKSIEYLDFCANEYAVDIMSGCKGGQKISAKNKL